MEQLILQAFFLIVIASRNIHFAKILNCVQADAFKCLKWNQTSLLSYSMLFPYGFSENTYVQTPQGPKSMKYIQFQDQILGYDPQKGQIYSKVTAWLHRDESANSKYHLIKTKDGPSFQTSQFHSIATMKPLGNIEFKLAKDLNAGDDLFETIAHVQAVQKKELQKGLYAPFTDTGNYYIFDSSLSQQIKQGKQIQNTSMVLVHALSQVSNPQSQMLVAKAFIQVSQYFGVNKQPKGNEAYSHPLITNFNFLFGSSWLPLQSVNYEVMRKSSQSSQIQDAFQLIWQIKQQQQQNKHKIVALGLATDIIFATTLM